MLRAFPILDPIVLTHTSQKAALFSAIVTAFVVQSYPSLQDSSPDTSIMILARISAQIAVIPPLSGCLDCGPPPFNLSTAAITGPTRNDIVINTLWFLSLTFSLLSAFFAISAQQWIRSLTPVPSHLSIWSAIRLRWRRQSSFIHFQIPIFFTYLLNV